MSDILCIGGPAHGQMANDCGACLRVTVGDDRAFNSLFDIPTLKHGPGYRRLPRIRPWDVTMATYVKRRLVDHGRIMTVYAMADYADHVLIEDYRATLAECRQPHATTSRGT